MSGKSTRKPRSRRNLSKAELKAYESRRADERMRIGANTGGEADVAVLITPTEHTFEITRDEEFAVIRADLKRLLIILAFIAVLMIALTIILR